MSYTMPKPTSYMVDDPYVLGLPALIQDGYLVSATFCGCEKVAVSAGFFEHHKEFLRGEGS